MQNWKFSLRKSDKKCSCWRVFKIMKKFMFCITAFLVFADVALVYYYNERKDFDNAAKFMGWGVILVCAGVFLKMAPTKLYGDSGFLRAYILSFLLSAVCGWYMLGIVENYKDGADTPVTLMKRQRTKLEDMGAWNLTFEVDVRLSFDLDESDVPGDLAKYDFHAANMSAGIGRRIELEKLPTRRDNFGDANQTVKGQVNFDMVDASCDYLPGICYTMLWFDLTWNEIAINSFKELSYGGDPIISASLQIRNPSSEADKIGVINLPHEEDPQMQVIYDVDAHQRKKIDGSDRKWFEFSVNNNVAGQRWTERAFESDLQVIFLIETNRKGEVWTRVMEEKPLFSASQAFTSFLAFCSALFAFFSYFFPKTLPKRRVKFSSAPLKFEAGSTFDVLEVTQVTEMVGKSSDSESGDVTEPREKTEL